MKKMMLMVVMTLLFLSGCGDSSNEATPASAMEGEKINETISIITFGDNLMHMPVVNSGKQSDGTYDYSHIFKHMERKIKRADIAVMGQETIFGGKELGYSGYPAFNSPSEMGDTLAEVGFDVVLYASNHVFDRGAKGIRNTLEFWKKYPEMVVVGINEEEDEPIDIIEVKGAKIALLNYTYGTNDADSPMYLVDYMKESVIKEDAEFAEENADFTVAFLHWGEEYHMKPNSEQKELAKKMCEWGVDLIIGAHPHVVQPVEWIESDNGNRMLVYYSLGNFVSRQLRAENILGGMADVKLKYDGEEVKIKDYKFEPVVTHYNKSYSEFTVYPLRKYPEELAKEHGVVPHDGEVSIERWEKILEETFEGYDDEVIER